VDASEASADSVLTACPCTRMSSEWPSTMGRALPVAPPQRRRSLSCFNAEDGWMVGGLDGSSGTANDLFNELDHDVALIGLCRLLGLHTDIRIHSSTRGGSDRALNRNSSIAGSD